MVDLNDKSVSNLYADIIKKLKNDKGKKDAKENGN